MESSPDYIIAQEDFPDFDDLISVDHPDYSLILLKSLAKSIEKEKGMGLEFESTKVEAKDQAKSTEF
jgi:hypothetical protein